MNALAEMLREEIRSGGPICFHRFMQAALYHPTLGYYRSRRDPFGRQGDFYTASQLQPVFGELIRECVRRMFEAMGRPADFTVVELGAGRGEMAPAFAGWRYIPLEFGDRLPEHFRGVAFSNEFFDALPVHVAVIRNGEAHEMRVGIEEGRFAWVESGRARDEIECYRKQYFSGGEEGQVVEVNLEALAWLEQIAGALESGYVFTIDYGYTVRELVRFPQGTLMSYRRHTALEDVLAEPGGRDITAHVLFTALEEHGARLGLETERLEALGRTLLTVGEEDRFAKAIGTGPEREQQQRRLQLKHLLFGLGETFRTLVQRKREK